MVTGKRISEIEGFENYRISERGVIYSFNTGNAHPEYCPTLTPRVDRAGYLSVHLYKNGKSHTRFVHRLLGEAFLIKRQSKVYINHIDGNKLNNCLDNLEFVSHRENVLHAFQIGLNSGAKKVYDTLSGKTFVSISQAATFCGIPFSTCSDHLRKGDNSFRLQFAMDVNAHDKCL